MHTAEQIHMISTAPCRLSVTCQQQQLYNCNVSQKTTSVIF